MRSMLLASALVAALVGGCLGGSEGSFSIDVRDQACGSLQLAGDAIRLDSGTVVLVGRLRNNGTTPLPVLRLMPYTTLKAGMIDTDGIETRGVYQAVPSVAPIMDDSIIHLQPGETTRGSIEMKPIEPATNEVGILLSYHARSLFSESRTTLPWCRIDLGVFFAWDAQSGLTPAAEPPPAMKGATAENPRGCMDLVLSGTAVEDAAGSLTLRATLSNEGKGPLVILEMVPGFTIFARSGANWFEAEDGPYRSSEIMAREARTLELAPAMSTGVDIRVERPSNETEGFWLLYETYSRSSEIPPHAGCEIRRLSQGIAIPESRPE